MHLTDASLLARDIYCLLAAQILGKVSDWWYALTLVHVDERDACSLAGRLMFACFVSPWFAVVTGVGTHFALGRCMRKMRCF